MSHVSVSLTTSGYIKESTMDESLETAFWKMNIPVCVADMGIFMSGIGDDGFFDICMGMAKTVYVDPDKKYVFIGEDSSVEDTGLVIYTDEIHDKYSDDFFKRWRETSSMIFQFRMKFGEKIYFSMKGLWNNGKWEFLKRVTESSFFEVCQDGENQ